MTLNFVLGTAAELIKMHPVLSRARARGVETRVIATGQSFANLEEQAGDFGLDPSEFTWLTSDARDLDRANDALRWFARAMRAPSPRPLAGEIVLVHGDTLSTLVGAWLGRRAGARVIHVEAGLRSRRLWNPFPEEITRRLVSRLAHVHAAPDAVAATNLRRARGRVFATHGNTLLDAVRDARIEGRPEDFALVNVHRFENLNHAGRWRATCDAVVAAAAHQRVLFVAHPPTRARLEREPEVLKRFAAAGVETLDRLPFSRFIGLVSRARYLISDGGSNQEECSYLGVPCLLLRLETERREGLGASCVLSRFDPDAIAAFLREPERFRRAPELNAPSPSDVILDAILPT